MATEITYGGYSFPHPYPLVSLNEAPIYIGGDLDYGALSISLVGEITGCGLSDLKRKKDDLVAGLSTGFQTLTIGNSGYEYAKPLSVNFPSERIGKIIPYQIEFEAYHEKDFSQYFGIVDPTDSWTFSEDQGRIVSATHNVSARAAKTSADSLLSARNFVNSRLNGYENISLFLTGAPFILERKDEAVNRQQNSYSVSETWRVSTSRNDFDISGAIVRAETQIDYNASDSVSVSVNGTIDGGISGSVSTGMFDSEKAKIFAQNSLSSFKIDLEDSFYGQVFREPNSYNYDIDTGSNSISFSFSFKDPTDPRNQEVIHNYDISVDASKDNGSVSVSLKGDVSYNSLLNPFTGSSPELETRFQKVNSGFNEINFYALAQEGFSWFTGVDLPYKKSPLNTQIEQFNIEKRPFDSQITYTYNYNNSIDIFSGFLENAQVSISTNHPFTKYGIKPTTDNSFSVQPLYDTILQKSINIQGNVSADRDVDDAISFVSGWANQYNSGLLVSDRQETGNRRISISKTFVIK